MAAIIADVERPANPPINPGERIELTPGEVVLNRRIDEILLNQKDKKAWYREAGTIIAIAAFIISLVTTLVSWYRTYQQDVDAMKRQLHAVIQQAGSLVIQHAELMAKYKDDNQISLNISSALNGQNIILAREAYSLAKSLGRSATSIDLASAANALIQSYEYGPAQELLILASERATNAVESYAPLRLLGGIQYQAGQRGEADDSFRRAVEVFRRYPSEANNETNVNITQAYSYMFWASAVSSGNCQEAKEHLAQAKQYADRMPPTFPQANVLRAEVERLSKGC